MTKTSLMIALGIGIIVAVLVYLHSDVIVEKKEASHGIVLIPLLVSLLDRFFRYEVSFLPLELQGYVQVRWLCLLLYERVATSAQLTGRFDPLEHH